MSCGCCVECGASGCAEVRLDAARRTQAMQIKAYSVERYRASARERRFYGGKTVTIFLVEAPDRDDLDTLKIAGYGPTPGQRKTDAIERARIRWGLS